MNILKIVNGFDDGGVFTSEGSYIRVLKQRGVRVDLIIIGEGDRVKAYQTLAHKSVVLPALHSNLGGSFLSRFREIYKIWKYAKKHKGEAKKLDQSYATIIYRRPIFIFLAGMLGRRLQTNVFWHMPNIVSNTFSKFFYTFFLTRYKITPLANSKYTRNSLPNICKHVIYPGFSANRVKKVPDNFRHVLKIGKEAPVFGMAGRICFDKAQDILVEAFVKSRAYREGGHLIFAGKFENDEVRRNLISLAGRSFDKQIHFLGRIDDLPKFYSTIDVALNARRNAEPFGISIAEALAAEKPVIAYYLGGPSEMIIDNVTGWLVRGTDVHSWSTAFDVSMASRAQWKEMGESASRQVEGFSVENNVTKLLKLIYR